MGAPVIHFEIGTKDLDRATRFYESLFDWDVAVDAQGYGQVETRSDSGISGGIMRVPEHVVPYVTVYAEVDDLDKYLLRAEELGGTRLISPMAIDGLGSFAMFSDPDGNAVGLFSTAQLQT